MLYIPQVMLRVGADQDKKISDSSFLLILIPQFPGVQNLNLNHAGSIYCTSKGLLVKFKSIGIASD